MTNDYLVYAHIRPSTGAVFYIGKGKQKRVRASANRNIHWHRIVAKEGGFDHAIVADGLSEREALDLEIETIAKYRANGVAICNMTDGGDGISGYKFSPEIIERLRPKLMGRTPWNKGRSPTDETREKLRQAKLGTKQSREHIENSRRARIGREVPAETCRKISEALTGKKLSEAHKLKKAKAVICKTTGTVYASMQEAADALGLWKSAICLACKGRLKQTGGYEFAYVEALTA